jgi:hypothetical protein
LYLLYGDARLRVVSTLVSSPEFAYAKGNDEHTYPVPGRMGAARLFSELPSISILGNPGLPVYGVLGNIVHLALVWGDD